MAASVTVGPGNVPSLPNPGDLNAQLASGQSLVAKLSDPINNAADLLGAGITTLSHSGIISSNPVPRTMVSVGAAALSGAAVGGPFGAVAGAVVALASSLLGLGGGPPPTFGGVTIDLTAGSGRLFQLVSQWQNLNLARVSGYPQGRSLADYLALKNPPTGAFRRDLMWALVSGNAPVTIWDDGTHYENVPGVVVPVDSSGNGYSSAEDYASRVATIDDTLFWEWASAPHSAASSVADYAADFDPMGAGSQELWTEDTHAFRGMSVDDIQSSAERRAPDPMYFAQDLWVGTTDVVDGSFSALIMQTAAASAMATILGHLAVGASTRAIVSELLLQQHVLYLLDYGSNNPPGGYASLRTQLEADLSPANLAAAASAGHPYTPAQIRGLKAQLAQAKAGKMTPPLPSVFRQLVEDYVALAHAEAHSPHASMASVCRARASHEVVPTSGKVLATGSKASDARAASIATVKDYLEKYLT